ILTISSPDSLLFYPSLSLCFFHLTAPPPASHSFPTRRSSDLRVHDVGGGTFRKRPLEQRVQRSDALAAQRCGVENAVVVELDVRSEEHTSELQSRSDLVCRLLLEKKKKKRSSI